MKKQLRFLLAFFLLASLFVFTMGQANRSLENLKANYANAESEFIEINGMPVHYRDEGVGPALVLVHGTAASLHTWDEWTESLKQDFRVIRLDIPAFGLTGPHPQHDYSVEAYTDFLHAFLEELEVDRFHLAGNSLGGYIAWYYASQYPEAVDRLVLLDPSGWPTTGKSPWIFRLARTPILNVLVKWITPKSIIRKNLQQVYFDDAKVSETLVERYHAMSLRKGNRAAFIARAKTPFIDHSSKLEQISAETLIIWGAEDTWISPDLGPKYEAAIPKAKLSIMDKVGHVPMEEAPEESVALIKVFLN
ncbi:MAG: alpha/beta hydrolase [Saprospiraceae bacterium]